MKITIIIVSLILLSGCTSPGIYFKETSDGVIIKPYGKMLGIFRPKLQSGVYEYSHGDKSAKADFKNSFKFFDFNLSKFADK